jgi:hypothetical protein
MNNKLVRKQLTKGSKNVTKQMGLNQQKQQ